MIFEKFKRKLICRKMNFRKLRKILGNIQRVKLRTMIIKFIESNTLKNNKLQKVNLYSKM